MSDHSPLLRWELRTCAAFNRLNQVRPTSRLFGAVSHVGNGIFWYVLMLGLLLTQGHEAALEVAVMAGMGLTGTAAYQLIKHGTRRSRPCAIDSRLSTTVAPLDRFSFPSGHTLHAVTFTIIATAAWPVLGWVLVPFTVLVALSRLVLGLHYPSDVLAGAALGATLGAWGVAILDALRAG